MVWGGLRGTISLVLVLSLPIRLGADRDLVRVVAFGVVLFTLLVQGTTNRFVIQRLGRLGQSAAERVSGPSEARCGDCAATGSSQTMSISN